MDASRQLPTHGDGLLDMREPARTPLESMVNELTDARADMPCEDGANARDGYRERGLATPVGGIAPRIPELRAGAYFPEGVIGRCSRADRAVAAAAAESWANGVPTRKMERIARKMGMERPSRDQVGAMRGSLDAEVIMSMRNYLYTNETYPIAPTPVGQRRQPTLPGFGYFCSSFLSTGTSLSL